MTPFGARIRELRAARGVTLKDMAAAIGVSSAYLSALELGRRGRPSWYLVQRIIAYFNVIWDEAEEIEQLARLSHPRVVIDTGGLGAPATTLANLLAEHVGELRDGEIEAMLEVLASARRRIGSTRDTGA